MGHPVEVVGCLWADRHLPASTIGDMARAWESSGGVDPLLLPDHLVNLIPPQLWTEENTPMAKLLKDPDSLSDVLVVAGYVLASAPKLGISIGTDAVRRGPAEMAQAMLTIANMAGGNAVFQFGAGENKQCKAYGHKRAEGLARMDEMLQIFRLFWDSKGKPFDFMGNKFTFEKATLGSAMPRRPTVFALGAGPKLLDYATSYADGYGTVVPPVFHSPEVFAQARADLLEQVERKGRDPKQFRFATWFPVLLAEDDAMLERAIRNPLVRWYTAVFGRIQPEDWANVGLPNPMPEGWTYYKDLVSHNMPQELVDMALSIVTDDHVRKGWVHGTADQCAKEIKKWIDAGADWVCPIDYMPVILDPSEGAASLTRNIELCKAIKASIT